MISYKENISIDIKKAKDEAIAQVASGAKKATVTGDDIEINRHSSFMHLLAPTGRIQLHAIAKGDQLTTFNCIIIPSIFTFKSALGYTLLSIIVWAAIFWFFPLNVYIIVFFVLHWIVMCFVALYLLVGFMAILTILLVIYNFTDFPFIYILVAWIVTLLITHLSLRYNRATLKQYLLAIANKINMSSSI